MNIVVTSMKTFKSVQALSSLVYLISVYNLEADSRKMLKLRTLLKKNKKKNRQITLVKTT